jgi:putative phosphoribosyl transferase
MTLIHLADLHEHSGHLLAQQIEDHRPWLARGDGPRLGLATRKTTMVFGDRNEAGRRLGERLAYLAGADVVVLGLPRGGVPVAFAVADALGAPLDVIVVRKLGVPFQPELAMGAIGEDGVRVLNREVLALAQVEAAELDAVERRERGVLDRCAEVFRRGRSRISLEGRTAVVVDDGIATGSTARAACQVARAHGAARVVLAVPVAPRSSIAELASVADEVVCLETPEPFFAVGEWYADFSQTSDEEVVDLLDRAAEGFTAARVMASAAVDPPVRGEDIAVHVGSVRLAGHLTVPEVLQGLVVFAHGSGTASTAPATVSSPMRSTTLGSGLYSSTCSHLTRSSTAATYSTSSSSPSASEPLRPGWLASPKQEGHGSGTSVRAPERQ